MKKIFSIVIVFFSILPMCSTAQEVGLSNNYKSGKFSPLKAGDLNVNLGVGQANRSVGLLFNAGAEYMLTNKLGLRASFSSNNISGGLRPRGVGAHRYSLDLTYHFIQSKRWDVYAFAGLGYNRYRYSLNYGQQGERLFNYGNIALNGGVGARYKIKPKFGVQLELGRMSSFGIYKGFSLKRKH